MDMSLGTFDTHDSPLLTLFFLFLIVYPWPVAARAIRAWRQRSGLSRRMICALSLPAVLALVLVWSGYERLLKGLLYSGSISFVIRAAGVAEAQVSLLLAAGVGAVLSLIAFWGYRRGAAPTMDFKSVSWLPLASLTILSGTTIMIGWWLVRSAFREEWFYLVWFGMGVCFVASAVTVLGMALKKRVEFSATTLLLLTIGYLTLAIGEWYFMKLHREIAMGIRAY